MSGVVIVSYPEDEHGTALERELRLRDVDVFRVSLSTVPTSNLSWRLGAGLTVDAVSCEGDKWAGIWRRPGHPDLVNVDPRYVEFAESESRDAFRGALLSMPIRWINDPAAIWRAEHKILQLETARRADIPVPLTMVTNDPTSAKEFASRVGTVIAKAVRYGLVATEPHPMMAWVTRVGADEAFEFAGIPAMLQAEVHAREHLRIVTVGAKVFASRLLASELDWRAGPEDDQRWEACGLSDLPAGVVNQARRIAADLALGYTSQDWVVDQAGRCVFLEANPNGQWLFLDDAHEGAVTTSIADWLTTEAGDD